MIKELWQSFPQLMEQKINALLDEAEPTSTKAFQLYKSCQRENLWNESFEKFSKHLETFFALPKNDRRKSVLDAIMDRPVDATTFTEFELNFRNAQVDGMAVQNIASWAHHLMRVSMKSESLVISQDVLSKTLNNLIHPSLFEKAQNILFEDFCTAWRKTVFALFGKKYDADLEKIFSEIRWLQRQIKKEESERAEGLFVPTIYLTQTEIDWTMAVQEAVRDDLALPRFPLSRGPQKQRMIDHERTLGLYRIVQNTRNPDFLKHKENIRATILSRCECLLRERAR